MLIIGAGQAADPLAAALSKAGKRVALAERKHLGGSCVNFGCTPTKAVLASAQLAHLARRAAEFGVKIPGVEVDFAAVLRRAKDILAESRRNLGKELEDSDNPRLLRGHARLDGRDGAAFRVRVGGETITAGQVVLDTGTRSLIPPIPGLDGVDCLHAGNWLDRPELPEHLAIIGGGYIGLEMSQFYRRMGSRVTLVEEAGQVTEREDEDVASALRELLEAEGIQFRLNARVKGARAREGGVTLEVEEGGAGALIEVSHVFVATGRKPNTDDLGLETVGVTLGEQGFVQVDERLATNVPGVWVAGDIRGGPQFTHTSWDDHRILLSQLTGDGSRTTDRVIGYAIFTDPQLGRAGMTEAEARRTGRQIKVARFDMKENDRATETGETGGFIKVVVDAETDRILGAAVLSAEGSELVHSYLDLMNASAPYTVIRDAVHIHPTLSEAVQSAVSSLD